MRCDVIPHSRPTIGPEDLEAVAVVLESGHLSQGPSVSAVERATARRLDRLYGVATSSGTAALALAFAALEVGSEDEVIAPAFACSAIADAVRFAGATLVLADVREDLALDPEDAARRLNAHTRAVVVVHPFGYPLDLRQYLEWEIAVVEDCAQALGASRDGRAAGSVGTVAVCSFYATKMVAAGEGGMLLADSADLIDKARILRQGGVPGTPGFNFKLSGLAAALGHTQLRRLHAFVARRRAIARRYDDAFEGTALRFPPREGAALSCFSRYVVRVPDAARLIAGLRERGVEAKRPVGDPLASTDPLGYPVSARAFAECASLPIYPSLSDQDVTLVIEAVEKTLAELGWTR